MNFYVRDSYDFNTEDEPLGYWGREGASASVMNIGMSYVENRHFRLWRERHGRGGDFIIFSDVFQKNYPAPFWWKFSMRKFLRILFLLISASTLIFGWAAWSVVHNVISQHFGAFAFEKFLLIFSGVGFAGLVISLLVAVNFSRFVVGLCGLLGSLISANSLMTYPPEEAYIASGAVFSPSPDELIWSLAFGGFLLLISIIWGRLIFPTKRPAA